MIKWVKYGNDTWHRVAPGEVPTEEEKSAVFHPRMHRAFAQSACKTVCGIVARGAQHDAPRDDCHVCSKCADGT